jgi:subtilisin family serine protease
MCLSREGRSQSGTIAPLVLIISLCLLGNSVGTGATNTLPKLVQPHLIIGPLEQNKQTVKVIVNLVQPEGHVFRETRAGMKRPQSVSNRPGTIKTSVLSQVSLGHIRLRHFFKGLSAFSAEVTALGLVDLVDNPFVESIEPIQECQTYVSEGIPLMGGTMYRSQYSGQGTAIAIIDDGVDYLHPDLGDGVFPNAKVIGGYDMGENDADPYSQLEDGQYVTHGTACAGIAGEM